MATAHTHTPEKSGINTDLFYGGENHPPEQPQALTCPLCGGLGFSEQQLKEHVAKQHKEDRINEVICPLCLENLGSDFTTHLNVDHRAARDAEVLEPSSASAMQNRVRRLIGRRRGGGGGGGLDRFIGMRDPAGSQDSVLVDPISELLAQLSGAGSGAPPPPGGGTRRILSDVPSHIQQLLEQQERQVLERGSPSRRPYRKIIISGGPGSEGAAGNGAPIFAWSKPEDFSAAAAVQTSRESRVPSANRGKFLLEEHSTAPLAEEELKQLPQVRARKSLFVQELLLSMLISSSSDDSSDDLEGGT